MTARLIQWRCGGRRHGRLGGVLGRLRGFLPSPAPACRAIAVTCIAVHIVQVIAAHTEVAGGVSFGDALEWAFGLHAPLLGRGFLWQPVTYLFLHGSWQHLGLNLLSLLLLGSSLEWEIGSGRFVRLFLVSGIVGGIGWMLADWAEPAVLRWGLAQPAGSWLQVLAVHGSPRLAGGTFGRCIGASGAVFGVIGAFAAVFPRQEMVLLPLPVRLRAAHVALLLMGVTVVEMVLGGGQVANAAHLAGGVAGYAWARRRFADLAGRPAF